MQRLHHNPNTLPRRGSLLPATVLSMLVVLGVLALVLNRLWIDTARVELQGAIDAAVLAAATGLVDDGRLKPGADETEDARRIEVARTAAAKAAASNLVAGERLQIHVDQDVRFGQSVLDETGREVFIETDHDPRTVMVRGLRSQERTNPLGLMLSGFVGYDAVDLATQAQASLDNHVVALRPAPTFNVPAFPLAILRFDPTGGQPATWQTQIDQRLGRDRYGIDPETQKVINEPDGLPEIELVGVDPNLPPNACLIDVGTKLVTEAIVQQIQRGLTPKDCESRNGELTTTGKAAQLTTTPEFNSTVCDALRKMTGKPRIVLLYESVASDVSTETTIRCCGFAAGRVMNVINTQGGSPRVIFQPAVLCTRAVVLASERDDLTSPVPENAYLWKVRITK